MSTIPVKNTKGKQTGEYTLSDDLLVFDKGLQSVQDAIVAYQANQRQGSASTLGKAEVAGSNRKLWKQKGTGRARTGFRQSPIWRGGGVTFGPKPRNYRKTISRRQARLAFQRAFSENVAAGQVFVLENLALSAPKTKEFAAILKNLDVRVALVITNAVDQNLVLASRNIPKVEITTAASVNTYQLVRYPVIMVTKDALPALEQRLSSEKAA
ncbi:MAG: 50S ribosomal protein L4 [Verrucomicrobiota bacterium]